MILDKGKSKNGPRKAASRGRAPDAVTSDNPKTPKHVTVLMGGWNAEADVSRSSGRGIQEALIRLGYQVTVVDIPRDPRALLEQIPPDTDVIFNALHGHGYEDGNIQGLLNLLGIPYTHSGTLASALSMDKPIAKKIFSIAGIPTPPGGIYPVTTLRRRHVMSAPYVVKPCYEGSSVGVSIVHPDESPPTLEDWCYGDTALVEEYIPGREIFVSIMCDQAGGHTVLGETEIVTSRGFYDYVSKYTPGFTEYFTPAPIDASLRQELYDISLKAVEVMACRGLVRTDIRYDPTRPMGRQLFLLEINTQPGFTPTSLTPKAAQMTGFSYDDLVQWLVQTATTDDGFLLP